MTLRISVVIPHYEDLDNLALCLDLLDRQTLPRDQWEVVVSDNMSPSGIERVTAIVAGRARVVLSPEKGAGPTRNRGASEAKGEALAFLDSDCRPEPGWLAAGLEALEQSPVIGGQVLVWVPNAADRTPSEAFETVFAFDNARYIAEEDFSVSANLLMRRYVWERVGGFRPSVSEDVDWCHRARDAGYRASYAPNVRVAHPARASFGELRRKWQRLVREAYLLTRERPFGRLRWILRTWAVALSPFVHAWKVLSTPKLETMRDRLNALGVLFAVRWFRFVEGHRILMKSGES